MRRVLPGFLLWLGVASAGAAEVMPAAPAQYFNDYAQVVSPAQAANFNQRLEDFERQTSDQILVAIYPKMQSDSALEDYTYRVAESWRVGRKQLNNGAVLFVFVQDHALRIEVGYGLEGALPDALAKQIIDEQIAPHFHNGDYAGGLDAGINAILGAVRGEYKGNGATVADQEGDDRQNVLGQVVWGVIFIFLVSSLIRRLRNAANGTVYQPGGRRRYFGGMYFGPGRWGGGGGGFGGGGFGGGGFSGGGGSFGGGGASGHW
jgi:uncharacterized protein